MINLQVSEEELIIVLASLAFSAIQVGQKEDSLTEEERTIYTNMKNLSERLDKMYLEEDSE